MDPALAQLLQQSWETGPKSVVSTPRSILKSESMARSVQFSEPVNLTFIDTDDPAYGIITRRKSAIDVKRVLFERFFEPSIQIPGSTRRSPRSNYAPSRASSVPFFSPTDSGFPLHGKQTLHDIAAYRSRRAFAADVQHAYEDSSPVKLVSQSLDRDNQEVQRLAMQHLLHDTWTKDQVSRLVNRSFFHHVAAMIEARPLQSLACQLLTKAARTSRHALDPCAPRISSVLHMALHNNQSAKGSGLIHALVLIQHMAATSKGRTAILESTQVVQELCNLILATNTEVACQAAVAFKQLCADMRSCSLVCSSKLLPSACKAMALGMKQSSRQPVLQKLIVHVLGKHQYKQWIHACIYYVCVSVNFGAAMLRQPIHL